MAAEMRVRSASPARSARRFNEAAANGRGNDAQQERVGARQRGFNEAAANGRGNSSWRAEGWLGAPASMRPRRMAAEIAANCGTLRWPRAASMRPRRMAAEM